MLDILTIESISWDAVLIQEGPGQEDDVLFELHGGHLWYVAACGGRPRSIGILLHRRWCAGASPPEFTTLSGRLSKVELEVNTERVILMSSHLPHAGKSDLEYEAALARMEDEIKDARKKKTFIIIGVDANAVVGEQSEHDSHRIIGSGGLHTRNERGVTFVAWLHS